MTDHQAPDQPGTDIALLPPADRALIVLKSTAMEAELLALIERTKPITAPKDKAGREEVHRAAMDHKNARLAIEKAAKAATEDAKEFTKSVSAEQKRLIAINAEEEERLFDLRNAYDEAEAARKAEEERKERERVDAIKAKIHQIADLHQQSIDDSAADLDATIVDLMAFEVTFEDFAEFQDEAKAVVSTTLAALAGLHDRAVAREAAEVAQREAEAALAAQREELARAQRELEEQRAAIARERAELEAAKQPVDTSPVPGADPEPVFIAPVRKATREEVAEMYVTAEPMNPESWTEPERTMTVEQEAPAAAQATPELRMNAYYFAFEPTGAPEIDMILSAVACAGKAYHHTEDWNDESGDNEPHMGNTAVEWIQNAAISAAEELEFLRARAAWLDCLEAAGVNNWSGIEEALRLRREGQA